MPKKLTKEEFIQKAKTVHGNHYDYSEVEYVNNSTKIKIKCNECNQYFYQTPRNHLVGQGCRSCNVAKGKRLRYNTNDFIKRANIVWNNFYDYSKVVYKGNREKVCIICPKHGEFWQEPLNHLNKHGCFLCRNEYISKNKTHTNEDFIKISQKRHGDLYNYTKVNYINKFTKVEIICKKHGSFWQTPDDHIRGCGCPICNESKGEKEIRHFLEAKGYVFNKTYFRNQKFSELGNLSYDFYIPSKNLLIEFNGRQHYEYCSYFHKDLHDFHLQKHHDWLKRKYAKDNKINLITIPYWEKDSIIQYFTI